MPSELEKFDFAKCLRLADERVKSTPLYSKFIEGTPLENDIAVWMALFVAEQLASAQAHPPPSQPEQAGDGNRCPTCGAFPFTPSPVAEQAQPADVVDWKKVGVKGKQPRSHAAAQAAFTEWHKGVRVSLSMADQMFFYEVVADAIDAAIQAEVVEERERAVLIAQRHGSYLIADEIRSAPRMEVNK